MNFFCPHCKNVEPGVEQRMQGFYPRKGCLTCDRYLTGPTRRIQREPAKVGINLDL